MATNKEKFPVTNKQTARIVQGIHTEVLVSGFKDKIFVVVTQYGRIGSLVRTMG
jgi:proteasome assembly chaperone 3